MTAAAPISLPNYKFLSVLGDRGMGKVWLAEQPNPHRKAAMLEPLRHQRSALFQTLTIP